MEKTKPDKPDSLLRIVREPIVWACAFFTATSEALLFNAEFVFPEAVNAGFADVSTLVSLAVYACLFLLAGRIASFRRKPWLIVSAFVVAILGLMLGAPFAGGSWVASLTGGVCATVCSVLLGYVTIEHLASRSLIWTVRALIASALISAFMVPLYRIDSFWSVAVPFAFWAVCLLLVERGEGAFSLRAAGPTASRFPVPWGLTAGLVLLSASFGFLQSFLYLEGDATVAAVSTITKLAAIAVFGAIALSMEDTGYPVLAKIVCTLAIAGLTIFLAFSGPSIGASAFMAMAYSVLESTYLLVMVNFAAASRGNVIRIVSAFYLVDSTGYLVGEALFSASSGGAVPTNVVAMALAILLAIAAIWLFSEKKINAFLWVSTSDPAEGGRGREEREATFEEKSNRLAELKKLSPRETEILRMFASGRSAAFIAETTFVSSNTVRTHIKHIYAKCQVHSRQELITLVESGLVEEGSHGE